jgi:hypothetical protein
MSRVVTALSQDGNVAALHKALHDAGLPTDSLNVIGPDESTESVSHGLAGSDLLTSTDGGATGVPGINNVHRPSVFFRNESIPDRLGDLAIPDSEIDNYVEALQRGRSVVYYFAQPDTIEKVEAIFRSSNVSNVRRF